MNKQLEKLTKEYHNIGSKIQAIKDKDIKEKALPMLRDIVGKCFKYRNSYGGSYEKWWLYLQVKSIDEKSLSFTCVEFQRTSMDIIEIKLDKKFNWNGKNYFDNNSSYIEIPKSEFNKAKRSFKKMIEKIID